MIQFRLYFDKDAATEWLNAMAAEGWEMKSFFAGIFRFQRGEEGKYTYQIDFGDRFFAVSDEYREFMQDTGVEIVGTWGYWVFLRKPASEGEFKLYTDVESSIEHYMKIRRMFKVATIAELICLFIELYAGAMGSRFAIVGVFLIAAFIGVFIRALVRTNNVIAELKERQTGIAEKRSRNVSILIPIGMLINSCALMMEESVSDPIRHIVQVIAIVFMLLGVYFTGRKRNGAERD